MEDLQLTKDILHALEASIRLAMRCDMETPEEWGALATMSMARNGLLARIAKYPFAKAPATASRFGKGSRTRRPSQMDGNGSPV